MMCIKYSLLLFFVACSSIVYGQDKSYDYCYSNDKGICVYSVADKAEQVIVKSGRGRDPHISPDGKKIVYATFSASKGDKEIIVIDLNTKQKVVLNTGSRKCYDPVWSPDGKRIAYHGYNEQKGDWDIAVMDANNMSMPIVLTEKIKNYWVSRSKNVMDQDSIDVEWFINSKYIDDEKSELLFKNCWDISAKQ